MATNPRAALRAALIDYAGTDRSGPLQVRADALAGAAERLLAWLEDNAVDPGDPPLCACGGHHWTCSAADAAGVQEPCEECEAVLPGEDANQTGGHHQQWCSWTAITRAGQPTA